MVIKNTAVIIRMEIIIQSFELGTKSAEIISCQKCQFIQVHVMQEIFPKS